jgi:predicted metal-dependent hydrolase
VQLQLLLDPGPVRPLVADVLVVGGRELPLEFVRNPRARRYVLRLTRAGTVRVTIPRGGSRNEGRQMADRHLEWLEKQWRKRHEETPRNDSWHHGTEVWFRGDLVRIEVMEGNSIRQVQVGSLSLVVDPTPDDLRAAVERHFRVEALVALPPRTLELAALHGLTVNRVTVRDQRSRWGSCSRLGTISLNWRLVQMPPAVSDYIILHELAHLRVMNHSRKYWKLVEQLCPEFRAAEAWLKAHGRELQSMPARHGSI